jgi:hypothetical protein
VPVNGIVLLVTKAPSRVSLRTRAAPFQHPQITHQRRRLDDANPAREEYPMNTIPIADNRGLKPALASIKESCRYMGNVSRAKFYADILPLLESIYFGKRHLVVVASMDKFIAANFGKAPGDGQAVQAAGRRSNAS